MHDPNLVYKVKLHRAPMRHRFHFHYVIVLIVYAKAESNLINVQLTKEQGFLRDKTMDDELMCIQYYVKSLVPTNQDLI